MIQLASKEQCSACGACAQVCSKKAITMIENDIGEYYPVINHEQCVECKFCINNCPILSPLATHKPYKAYCAFSDDRDIRINSASGGVATTAYQYAIGKGYYIVGAAQDSDFYVRLKVTNKISVAKSFQNSKYVFSQGWDSFYSIKQLLKEGEKVLVIALPCQIAAIRKLCHDHENLICGEVVCHGTTPTSYLLQHIKWFEESTGSKVASMFFRDPSFDTSKFYLSFYDKDGKCLYAKRTIMGDTYQYGYHQNISYRENCYNCFFAKIDRHADFTLNDYKQLGKCAPTQIRQRTNNSTILINTPKGQAFIDELIFDNVITVEERPVAEPVHADLRIRESTRKKTQRYIFERAIKENCGDFESAIVTLATEWRNSAIKKERKKKIKECIKSFVKKILWQK